MATNKNYLMIEELNSDRGEPQMLQNFQMGSTVKDLKLAIANLLGDGTDWHAIMTIFVGEEMEDSSKPLSFYKVQNTDTIFYVRSVEPPPPYELPDEKSGATDAKATAGTATVVTTETTTTYRTIKTVFFANIEGRSMTLEDLAPTMKISEVKAKLVREKHIEVGDEDRFVFGGKNLVDDRTLMDYNIQDRSTIQIVWRLHGGM